MAQALTGEDTEWGLGEVTAGPRCFCPQAPASSVATGRSQEAATPGAAVRSSAGLGKGEIKLCWLHLWLSESGCRLLLGHCSWRDKEASHTPSPDPHKLAVKLEAKRQPQALDTPPTEGHRLCPGRPGCEAFLQLTSSEYWALGALPLTSLQASEWLLSCLQATQILLWQA